MIIGACGYGGTGSSAVKDLLKEYDGFMTLDRAEFQLAFKVDGLQDLEYHLVKQYSRHMSGDIAIKRFLESAMYAKTPIVKKIYVNNDKFLECTKKFIESITQTTWRGFDNFDFETKNPIYNFIVLVLKKTIIPFYERVTKKTYSIWPMRKMTLSIRPDFFYEAAKIYTNSILKLSGADFDKNIVLDQPFEGNAPEQSFPFFDNPYAIVIDRDPRDLYIAASYQWPDGTFMPRRDPNAFVEYYKRQRMNLKENRRVLRIKLEDMIFEYEKTVGEIEEFLGLDNSQHINPRKYFDPEISIKGVQLFEKIEGHKKEIEYIEKYLAEFLYPFSNYEKAKNNKEIEWIP